MIIASRKTIRDGFTVYSAKYKVNKNEKRTLSEIIEDLLFFLEHKFNTDEKLLKYIEKGFYDAGQYRDEVFVQITV